jgi:hypothetical protein
MRSSSFDGLTCGKSRRSVLWGQDDPIRSFESEKNIGGTCFARFCALWVKKLPLDWSL